MVSNTAGYGVSESDWEDHITEAIYAHIDAFALNIASGDSITESFVGNAFLAAQNVGFRLFFSFDYGEMGPGTKATGSAFSIHIEEAPWPTGTITTNLCAQPLKAL